MKNIRLLLVLFASILLVSSCVLNDYDEDYEEYVKEYEEYQQRVKAQYLVDSTLIADYLVENDSVALYENNFGIFYHVLNAGDSTNIPDAYSFVEVKYKGLLLDGMVFDETPQDTTSQFLLSDLIAGWQIGLPKIGSGGKIILYLPSFYGYGEKEVGDVPANSVLLFDIDLVDTY